MTIPLAPIAGMLPMIMPSVQAVMDGRGAVVAAEELTWNTAGIDISQVKAGGVARFDAGKLISNITPLVAGLLVHKFVGGPPLNLNATLSRAKVPFVRL